MLVNLLQACRQDPAVTCHGWRRHLGTQSLPSAHICENAFPSIHAGNNFALTLERSHSQDTRAMMVTSQKTLQADDLEDISLTSLSGPVLNMGCNILCSLGPGPGMSSHSSKWRQIHPVPWDAAPPALHYSLHKNARRISSVGFSDFHVAAREFSHASGCYIKDPFYIRVFHSVSPLITY